MAKRPELNSSLGNQELDRAEKEFKAFDENIKELTMDRMNMAPKQDVEPQTKLSQKDIEKSKDIYLKPKRAISSREKFNEDYRKDYEFAKEYVQMVAENKEIIGECIEIWTKPFAGMPAEFWEVPVNKPIWAPRYLAEQIKRKNYHRLSMQEDKIVSQQGNFSYTGSIVVDSTIQRLDAHPVSERKSIFMGAQAF